MENKLAKVMTQLLDHAGLTTNGLAVILGIPTPTIYRLAMGDVTDPRLSTMTLIADYFGITIEQLTGRAPLDKKFYKKKEE
ncbi:MAG: hypothetical protein A3E84_04660 [Gammaproteobacteria bacterium RIFCSPHIGHO2_12_FULL_42_13]|nr:MAG: hypothetical protein A3E84_04660 [Gammaproteobacteria bacterium RIFCSPHIGHO2_12_FULL_42_13]